MYTIGRLARRARVRADSIRYYERQGLVTPATKTPSGYRLFTDAALRRLVFIKQAQRCGLSLAEIGKLLQLHETAPVARVGLYRLAAEKKREIDNSIAMLRAMSEALSSILPRGTEHAAMPSPSTPEESPLVRALEAQLSQQERERNVVAINSAEARARGSSSLYR